jgi:hypothetical protein
MATKLRIGCKRKGRFRRGKDRRLPRLVCGDTLCQSFEAKTNASSHRINVSEVRRVAEDFQVAWVRLRPLARPGHRQDGKPLPYCRNAICPEAHPLKFDPSYWTLGLKPAFSLHGQLAATARTCL